LHKVFNKTLYKMEKKKYKRKKSMNKTMKVLKEIKKRVPNIIFKAQNLVVTLKTREQLKVWLKLYPNGTYTINN